MQLLPIILSLLNHPLKMLSSGSGQNEFLFAGSQEEKLEGAEVHAEG